MLLFHGDCLEELKNIEDNSIDLFFADLPYGQTSCKWDCLIDLDKLWENIMRVKKLNTPIIFTCTTKFGVSLIQSAPKKCPFRYDLVWCKSAPCGFLSAKKMPMRKHEMIYVFYEKLPFYDLSSHKYKFVKEVSGRKGNCYKDKSTDTAPQGIYNPPLPTSLIKEGQNLGDKGNECYGKFSYYNNGVMGYQPPLPTSLVKENCNYDVNKNAYGGGKEGRIKISKDKKDHVAKYDPPLPTSLITENIVDKNVIDEKYENKGGLYSKISRNGLLKSEPHYEPPLPDSLLEIKSVRGKHSTEKPVDLMKWILKYYSKEEDVVIDCTMGSGSMGVACKEMNRNFIGIEKDDEIFSIAWERINE
jgi:DNA modification methylase